MRSVFFHDIHKLPIYLASVIAGDIEDLLPIGDIDIPAIGDILPEPYY
jgi:hypothetical protein